MKLFFKLEIRKRTFSESFKITKIWIFLKVLKLKKRILLQNDVGSARLIFDDFLDRYSYCYDYWKKFAEMEKRNGNMSEAAEVGFFKFLELEL